MVDTPAWQAGLAGVEHLISLIAELQLKHSIVYRNNKTSLSRATRGQGIDGQLKVLKLANLIH